jgi:hypothetical protein
MAAEKKSATAVEVTPKLVQLLTDLNAEERHRAISAAMILLGHPAPALDGRQIKDKVEAIEEPAEEGMSGKSMVWLKKSGLTREQLDHVFSIEHDGIDVIAAKLPGKSKRQQTLEAYVLCGLKSFVQAGETDFADKDARDLCEKVGCYDTPNHSNYMKAFGNLISGSKEGGWKLTNPGLSKAAEIVKQLTEAEHA